MFRHSLLCVLMLTVSQAQCVSDELQQLPYRNPGLVVDLGVGLWAWPVPCDADSDGDYDLIVSCPDKPSNGVWYFENRQGKVAMPVFQPAVRLSHTVHYVMPSYVDGALRVLSPGTEYEQFTSKGLQQKLKLPIASDFHKPVGTQPKGPKVRHNQWRYVDFDGDGHLDLVVGIEDWSDYGWDDAWNADGQWVNGPLHGWVYVFRNRGTTQMPDYDTPQRLMAGDSLLETYGCPSPNFEDFDNDGDLDLLCGEFLNRFTWFENRGTRTAPVYAPGQRVLTDSGDALEMELQMIVPVAFDWDSDGDHDLIVGDEDGRVAFVENVSPKNSRTAPVFRAPVYFQQFADTLKCGALATPCGVDWDADGDQDIVSGNTGGWIEIFRNESGPGESQPTWSAPQRLQVAGKPFRVQAGSNGSIQGPAEAQWGYTTLTVADWDGDDLKDVVFNSILGKVQWLKNTGTPQEPRFDEVRNVDVEWNSDQPHLAWGWLRPEGKSLLTQWRTTPVVHDFNGDGLNDLVMMDHEGYLAFFERRKTGEDLVLMAPRRAFVDEARQPIRLTTGVAGRSGRRKLCVTDWDHDGRFDFLLNSANADLLRQVDSRDGLWIMKPAGSLAKRNIEGHDVSPTVVDFNGDGLPDFLGGAEDGRFYFLQNPLSR